jgi:Histidine kinase-, DNA gyrase B-, and HSP90-like ATPase
MARIEVEPQAGSSVIALDRFIQATRDSGYKGTGSAIAELVDNALEAGAREIRIDIYDDAKTNLIRIDVLDNGSGMDVSTLQQALRFGGSSRFNSRNGMGRYGMGLPNSSVSQAQRVEVTTWQEPSYSYATYLDVNEIASGGLTSIPRPRRLSLPELAIERKFPSGTIVSWINCDRLDFRRAGTLAEKLDAYLGRVFRHFIWSGIEIVVNGRAVRPLDPLFISKRARHTGATIFGKPLEFEVQMPVHSNGHGPAAGRVMVTFSLLPVAQWHALTNDEKRERGIAKGAGMSIIRAGREVDYGWWFFGEKRKENYDDWWRCELRFEPTLDEAFGITHTKQQIRPTHDLVQALAPDIEATAKVLNRKVREAHEQLKFVSGAKGAETLVNTKERLLPALATSKTPKADAFEKLVKKYPHLVSSEAKGGESHPKYSLITESFRSPRFFQTYRSAGQIIVALNTEHPFYRRFYLPITESQETSVQKLRQQVDLMILSLARSELSCKESKPERFLTEWSNVLSTFLA